MQKLTQDGDPQVQVAAVRALSELEGDTLGTANTLKELLNPGQTNVLVRRATAESLAHMVDLVYQQRKAENRSRPQPPLKALEQIFPVAASALADPDLEVRRSTLLACQRTVTIFDDLIEERKVPVGRMSVYDPMVAVLRKNLPALNRRAGDSDPELRIAACHLLETLEMVAQKVRLLKATPAEPKEPTEPSKEPAKEPRKGVKTHVPSPMLHRARSPSSSRPSQWAATRLEQPTRTMLLTPVPLRDDGLTPAVTLDRPVKLPTEQTVCPAAFAAEPIEELPAPAPQSTIDTMIAGLSDPDFRVRLASLDVLETFGDRAVPAIDALVSKGLSDPNKFVRWASARTLGRFAPRKAKEVVPGLMRLLNDQEDMSVRITAAFALERYGPDAKEAVPLLARVINRGDKDYMIAILHTMQGIGTDAKAALPSVAWIMRNRELPTSVRVEAAQTLGRFSSLAKGQMHDLRQVMVNDPNEEVRNAASSAILSVDRPK